MLKAAATSVTSSTSTKAATGAESENNIGTIHQNFSVQQAGMRKGGTMDPSYVPCSFRAFPNPGPHQYSKKVSFLDPSNSHADGTNSRKTPYKYSKFYKGRKDNILPPDCVSNHPDDDFESFEISSI
jgi:hypothetical protein